MNTTKEIKLSGIYGKGISILVSEEDFVELNKKQWYLTSRGYAARTIYEEGKAKKLLMHRAILNAKAGEEVDHINRNSHDNRRENIRLCTHSENMLNRVKFSSGTPSNRLTREQVKEIRAAKSAKKTTLATQYGTSVTTIYRILKGQTWRIS